jgi:hypothetical protein
LLTVLKRRQFDIILCSSVVGSSMSNRCDKLLGTKIRRHKLWLQQKQKPELNYLKNCKYFEAPHNNRNQTSSVAAESPPPSALTGFNGSPF